MNTRRSMMGVVLVVGLAGCGLWPDGPCELLDESTCRARPDCRATYATPRAPSPSLGLGCMPFPDAPPPSRFQGCAPNGQACIELACDVDCPSGLARDPVTGCPRCSCAPPAPSTCQPVVCALYCPNGFSRDPVTRCERCDCAPR